MKQLIIIAVIVVGLVILGVSLYHKKPTLPSGIGPVADGEEYGKNLAELNK